MARRPLEGERIYLEGGRRTTQLMRDSLGRPSTITATLYFVANVDALTPHPAHPFFYELSTFVLAVIVGSLAGLATNLLLAHWVSPSAANNAALALATTCTGAAHSHFVHRQPWLALLPKIGAGAPLAYAAMRLVHVVLGS